MVATKTELLRLMAIVQKAAAKADDSALDAQRAVDALKMLEKQEVNSQVLIDSQVGKEVKKLSKHGVEDVATAASSVVQTWKKVLSQSASVDSSSMSKSRNASSNSLASSAKSSAAKIKKRMPPTGDAKRDKARELFTDALAMAADDVAECDPEGMAVALEMHMYKEFHGTSKEYLAKLRSLTFNLKDVNNPDLRRDVLSGDVTPQQLITMSPAEMASKERKKENEEIKKAMLKDIERGNANVATTDMFQCGKCKKRRCTYFQMQTRSADEPMTTFVTCMECNNKWKFC